MRPPPPHCLSYPSCQAREEHKFRLCDADADAHDGDGDRGLRRKRRPLGVKRGDLERATPTTDLTLFLPRLITWVGRYRDRCSGCNSDELSWDTHLPLVRNVVLKFKLIDWAIGVWLSHVWPYFEFGWIVVMNRLGLQVPARWVRAVLHLTRSVPNTKRSPNTVRATSAPVLHPPFCPNTVCYDMQLLSSRYGNLSLSAARLNVLPRAYGPFY